MDSDFILDEPKSVEHVLNRIVVEALPKATDAEQIRAVARVLETRRQEADELIQELKSISSKKTDDPFDKFCRYTQVLDVFSTFAEMLHGEPRCHMGGCPLPALPCEHGFCWGCHELGTTCEDAERYRQTG